ncbi:hypothetical protein JCM8208_007076 [Rhodotorula glutinis]
MSLSDLTRSYTTFPTPSSTPAVAQASSPASSQTTPSSYSYTPRTASVTWSMASEGPSNIPGMSIAAGSTAVVHSAVASSPASSSGGGVDGLALGLGLGLGLGALLTVLAVALIFRQRKSQRADFEQRAEVIRAKMQAAHSKQGDMREAHE